MMRFLLLNVGLTFSFKEFSISLFLSSLRKIDIAVMEEQISDFWE
jgi:hypothetical protein